MTIELRLPDDFDGYAGEVEAKGVFWDAMARIDDREIRITFYDPARLAQDVAEEIHSQKVFALGRLVVVERTTREHMETAVASLPSEFFNV